MRPWHPKMFGTVWRPDVSSPDGVVCSALGHSMMFHWGLEAQRDGEVWCTMSVCSG